MNSQILRKITEKTASAEEFIEENHEALSSSRSIVRSCFEFLQKVFLGLMYPFSCVLWAIFWSFSLLKMPQKLIPNHRTINSKQLLKDHRKKAILSLSLRKQRYPDFLQLKKRTFSKRAYPLKHKALKRRQSKFHQ